MAKEDLRKNIMKAGEPSDPRKRLFQEQPAPKAEPEEKTVPKVIEEPQDRDITPVRKKKSKTANLVRKTYFLSPELIEAIRIYAFEERKDISEAVRFLLLESIPEKYITEERKYIK